MQLSLLLLLLIYRRVGSAWESLFDCLLKVGRMQRIVEATKKVVAGISSLFFKFLSEISCSPSANRPLLHQIVPNPYLFNIQLQFLFFIFMFIVYSSFSSLSLLLQQHALDFLFLSSNPSLNFSSIQNFWSLRLPKVGETSTISSYLLAFTLFSCLSVCCGFGYIWKISRFFAIVSSTIWW